MSVTCAFALARRSFVAKNYPILKKLNPSMPILIREAAGAEPKLIARFGMLVCAYMLPCCPALHVRVLFKWRCELCVYTTSVSCLADFGVERAVSLSSLNEQEIDNQLETLARAAVSQPKSAESNSKFADIL